MRGAFEVGGEQVELVLPETAIAIDPLHRVAQRLDLERSASRASLALNAREASALQHADVLRDRHKRDVIARRELADGVRPRGEPAQNVAPRGIGEGSERRVELV
jgi:hypothetical protein